VVGTKHRPTPSNGGRKKTTKQVLHRERVHPRARIKKLPGARGNLGKGTVAEDQLILAVMGSPRYLKDLGVCFRKETFRGLGRDYAWLSRRSGISVVQGPPKIPPSERKDQNNLHMFFPSGGEICSWGVGRDTRSQKSFLGRGRGTGKRFASVGGGPLTTTFLILVTKRPKRLKLQKGFKEDDNGVGQGEAQVECVT